MHARNMHFIQGIYQIQSPGVANFLLQILPHNTKTLQALFCHKHNLSFVDNLKYQGRFLKIRKQLREK